MILLQKIEDMLRQADIEGFIKAGAPEDEYNDEAYEIAKAIEKLPPEQLTVENIAALVANIWTESFKHEKEETDRIYGVFLNIARNLVL